MAHSHINGSEEYVNYLEMRVQQYYIKIMSLALPKQEENTSNVIELNIYYQNYYFFIHEFEKHNEIDVQ